jgi:hypothetical protein
MKKIQLLVAITILAILASCSNDDDPITTVSDVLTVTTATPILTPGIAKLGGEVTKDGGKTVTERGVCIGESLNPVITYAANVTEPVGNGLGIFTKDFDISSAPAGTIFHYRAYAKNADGTAYGEDKTITIPAIAACPVINITANITTPTTWIAGNVYLINLVNALQISSTLTIQPGTVIKLNGSSIDITGNGKIIANGTATNPIIFTSFADDSFCGDSNGDGATTSAAKGDWQSLYINGGTGMTFTYCGFYYGGKARAGVHNVINIGPANVSTSFDNCEFAHTLGGTTPSDYAFNARFDYMQSVPTFTNNALYDNDRPISIAASYSLNTNNVFHDPSDVNIKNARNGIFLEPTNIPAGVTTTWSIIEVPYVAGIQLQALNGSTLNIGANVKVKFVVSTDYLAGYNNSVNLNASAILTSYKDDTVGGDTNGDGTSSTPNSGDWKGFSNNTPALGTFWINSANIRYAIN